MARQFYILYYICSTSLTLAVCCHTYDIVTVNYNDVAFFTLNKWEQQKIIYCHDHVSICNNAIYYSKMWSNRQLATTAVNFLAIPCNISSRERPWTEQHALKKFYSQCFFVYFKSLLRIIIAMLRMTKRILGQKIVNHAMKSSIQTIQNIPKKRIHGILWPSWSPN